MGKEKFIYGIRPVIEAIKSGKEIDRILLQKNLKGETFRELFSLVREMDIPFQFVPPEKLNRLSHQNHQGVIAWLPEIMYQRVEDILMRAFEEGKSPLILILDGITDVRNLGSIARTAECAGVHAIILPVSGSAQINSEAVKSSAGALYKVPVCRSSEMKETIRYLKESGLAVIASSEHGMKNYTQANMTLPVCVMLGSEGAGIRPEYLSMCDETVFIPLQGEIGSLNVSVAAGVLLFEVNRQRNVYNQDPGNIKNS
jgi:23S rRNA (guanosine2251-2'-O)-methyltransferase